MTQTTPACDFESKRHIYIETTKIKESKGSKANKRRIMIKTLHNVYKKSIEPTSMSYFEQLAHPQGHEDYPRQSKSKTNI
jgi:hypothetical protein